MLVLSPSVLLFSTTGGPLTVDNVVEAVDSVKGRWRDLGKRLLGEALHITTSYLEEFEKLSSNEERLRSVIHMWLPIDPYASWRRIIQTLDGIGEHELAGNLHHRAEPVTGMPNNNTVLEQWNGTEQEMHRYGLLPIFR